ncbi:MAG: hypothetical protein HQK84_04470 [Nitrospinae bacterium]|nr:hypothetical protein [Nitrospinota bacterium]
MSSLETITYDINGKIFSAELTPLNGSGSSLKSVISLEGNKVFSVKFSIAPDLMEKWNMDLKAAEKFLLAFAKPYSKVRTYRNNLSGQEDYPFDMDFASVKPESLVEKITNEWNTISG